MASLPADQGYGEDPWNLATLFPPQGEWTEIDYLQLTQNTNKPVELNNGRIEVLPMPTQSHQRIVLYLFAQLQAIVGTADLGTILVAPFRVRVADNKFREPDLMFLSRGRSKLAQEDYWLGADLVVAVTSNDRESRRRDYETKRVEYALAGIAEYWIVDPLDEVITVLRLDGEQYLVHGEFRPEEVANSVLLNDFVVDVSSVFAAAKV